MSKYVAIPHGKFATWMDQKLRDRNISRHELSDLIGISQATVLNYYGMKTKPRRYIVEDICDILNDEFDIIWAMVEEDYRK